MKTCKKCQRELELSAFGKNKQYKDGLMSTCRTCVNAKIRKQYYDSKQHRNLKYLSRYGITLEEVEAMAIKQNSLCPICDKECGFLMGNRANAFVVDHCHDTGKIRGLICSTCNRAMGFMRDNPELLRKAAAYLEV